MHWMENGRFMFVHRTHNRILFFTLLNQQNELVFSFSIIFSLRIELICYLLECVVHFYSAGTYAGLVCGLINVLLS